jgi:DNA polymerase III epsilon subunit-like protein
MTKVQELLEYFTARPEALRRSAKETAIRRHCTAMEVCQAKELYRSGVTSMQEYRKPRILLLDIETAPLKAYVWSRWKQNIYLEQTISEWFMLSWSAKWLGEEEIMSDVLTGEEALNENDERIVYSIWKLLNECNIAIGHNAGHFDVPKMNARFVVHGFPPTTPYKIIDTKDVAKNQFAFSSNKLDALATYFGIENKISTDFYLWKSCLEGDESALNDMREYNKMDVVILEKVYLRLRPYIKNHPNTGLFIDKAGVCPYCGSAHVNPIEGEYAFNNTTVNSLFRCNTCGAVSRSAINEYPKEFKKSLIRAI